MRCLQSQVEGALALSRRAPVAGEILFAYEPVWAIGVNGIPASADYADARQALIKQFAAEQLGSPPTVLYGGSVNPANAPELIAQPNIDGLFIGRSAWQPDGYLEVIGKASATATATPRA